MTSFPSRSRFICFFLFFNDMFFFFFDAQQLHAGSLVQTAHTPGSVQLSASFSLHYHSSARLLVSSWVWSLCCAATSRAKPTRRTFCFSSVVLLLYNVDHLSIWHSCTELAAPDKTTALYPHREAYIRDPCVSYCAVSETCTPHTIPPTSSLGAVGRGYCQVLGFQ